jgi:putative transcriptional regulator
MDIAAGNILISSATMDDDNFQQSVVFIAEHNANGAMAFVVNKLADRCLNELVEFSSSPSFPLYNGGPVDTAHLFFIHRRNDIIADGTLIIDNIYLGGDFKQAVTHINNKVLTQADIKIFIGYCGWDNGELEAEIAEGNWLFKDNNASIVFEKQPFNVE